MAEPAEESIGSHFFAIKELLLLVLSYLSPPGKALSSIDTNTDTLANLARVSRNISNAALDALWRSINQPDPIIRLLPSDAYELLDGVDTPRRYKLKRSLTPNDFVAFDKYAPRIRYVDFSNSSKILGPGCELFPHIKNFRDPILPALADFRWEPSVLNGCIGAFYLLSRESSLPSQEFSLLMWSEIEQSEYESDAIARTIEAFNDPALPWLPDVKKLTLRTLNYLPAVETAIQRFYNLEHFSCDLRVSDALFAHLAVLPRLRFLDLRSLPWIATTTVAASHDAYFPALEGLRISGTLRSVTALLTLVSSPQLLSVRLKAESLIYPAPSHDPSPSLSSTIVLLLPPSVPARTSTAGLAHFTFVRPSSTTSFAIANPGGGGPAHLPLAAFSPLYACTGLQTFRIDVDPLAVGVTDADVRAMAQSWPLLVTLTIAPPRARREAPPDVGLYALWALARGCPRLRTLAIEVDADTGVREVFRTESEEGVGAASTSTTSGHAVVMEELTLYSSPCGDPLLVADFLKRAFPRLPSRAFYVYWSPGREERHRWDVVTEALASAESEA
ncbi:hypothetical protein K438DRAFT_702376 [Mycena galopus ATCC 62051]|nr:hypothetical protein K438DRAFT_702376 [Mycena galopus ATCC 62051]